MISNNFTPGSQYFLIDLITKPKIFLFSKFAKNIEAIIHPDIVLRPGTPVYKKANLGQVVAFKSSWK